jgi:hypothetical protein
MDFSAAGAAGAGEEGWEMEIGFAAAGFGSLAFAATGAGWRET